VTTTAHINFHGDAPLCNIASISTARKLPTCVFYTLRDAGQCLASPPAGPLTQTDVLRGQDHKYLSFGRHSYSAGRMWMSASGPAPDGLVWCGRRVGGLGPGLTC